MKLVFAAVCASAVLLVPARGQMITVTNHSFDIPNEGGAVYAVTGTAQGAPTNGGTNSVPSWTFVNNEWSGTYGNSLTGATGPQVAFINVNNGSGTGSITSSSAVTTIAAGAEYDLTVGVGNPSGTGAFADPGNIVLNLLASTAPNSGIFTVAATNLTPIGTADIPDGTLKYFTISLTPAESTLLSGDQLKIQMEAVDGPSGQYQAVFDNVSLNEIAAPEPSTYAVIALALVLFGWCARGRVRT